MSAGAPVTCTVASCRCSGFTGSVPLRSCDVCGHGWTLHAVRPPRGPRVHRPRGPVEAALPGPVFQLSALVLSGAQAVPVRLKILLDRLFSVLTLDQVGGILQSLGWSLGDYVRGYKLEHAGGAVLDRWSMVTPGEEVLLLQEFLRFGETRPIVELMALQRPPEPDQGAEPTSCQSRCGTRRFRTSSEDSQLLDGGGAVRRLERFAGGLSLLLPFQFPRSALAEDPEETQKSAGGGEELDPDESLRPRDPRLDQNPHQEVTSGPGGEAPPSSAPSSLCPPSSMSQKSLHSHCPASTLPPLPSISPFFLSPLGTSSPLHLPPPSLCSFPPPDPAGAWRGRVSCSVCGKSFYDKGTLKIHHSAVHLRTKHGCTVPGCPLLFSSLRSRNRHSANPNPRLHVAVHAHTHQQRDTCTADGDRRRGGGRGRYDTPPRSSAPPPPQTASSSLSSSPAVPRTNQQPRRPNRKSRKSSTPLKIEREVTEERGGGEEEKEGRAVEERVSRTRKPVQFPV